MSSKTLGPLSDAVIVALGRLVDDAQTIRRDPSHSAIGAQIQRAGLSAGDPYAQFQRVGKEKRLRQTLSWALEHDVQGGEQLVASMIAEVRAVGGFRSSSPNYVGSDAIQDAVNVFRVEGYELTLDGELRPLVLDGLSGTALTEALEVYVRRAKRGAADGALLTGTSKDLLEATAAHVVKSRFGDPAKANFPTLLEWAFISLEMATPKNPVLPDEPARRKLEREMFNLACAINQLRNKEGSGHGRPWLASVTEAEAKSAIEFMGCIAQHLLSAHKAKR